MKVALVTLKKDPERKEEELVVIGTSESLAELASTSDGFLLYQDPESKLFGYIDANFQIVVKPQYLDATPFKNSIAFVRNYLGWWGAIDTTFEPKIPLEFYKIRWWGNLIHAMRNNCNNLLFDANCNFSKETPWGFLDPIKGLTWTKLVSKGRLGIIRTSGEIVREPSYNMLLLFEKFAICHNNDKSIDIISITGKTVEQYDSYITEVDDSKPIPFSLLRLFKGDEEVLLLRLAGDSAYSFADDFSFIQEIPSDNPSLLKQPPIEAIPASWLNEI